MPLLLGAKFCADSAFVKHVPFVQQIKARRLLSLPTLLCFLSLTSQMGWSCVCIADFAVQKSRLSCTIWLLMQFVVLPPRVRACVSHTNARTLLASCRSSVAWIHWQFFFFSLACVLSFLFFSFPVLPSFLASSLPACQPFLTNEIGDVEATPPPLGLSQWHQSHQ